MRNEEPFQIREEGDLRLIVPHTVAAVSNGAWDRTNLWWRSRVETLNGDTVSQSFGKFFNLGQGPLSLNIGLDDVARACQRQDAIATLKMDGSTLIRSVWQGKVMFRTRGSFTHTHLDNADEVDEFCKRYPLLGDPSYLPDTSLLFEWVTPRNIIVIRYPNPELYLIGAVAHARMCYLPMGALKQIAETMRIPVVEHFPMTEKGWENLYASLDGNHEDEGYVIRLDREQSLVKVKTPHYLTKHALKSNLTTERLVDLWLDWNEPVYTGYLQKFSETFDEETCVWAMPTISTFFDGVREFVRMRDHLHGSVAANIHLGRKEFAMLMQQRYGQTKKMAYAMLRYTGQPVKRDLIKSLVLQVTKQREEGNAPGFGAEE